MPHFESLRQILEALKCGRGVFYFNWFVLISCLLDVVPTLVGMVKCDSFATNFQPLVEQNIHLQGCGVVLNLSLEVMWENAKHVLCKKT